MGMNPDFWKGKRVLVTGHTGFKGSWLSLWLSSMKAEVYGFALEPTSDAVLFTCGCLDELFVQSTIADIRDSEDVERAIDTAAPDIVFHLAAQALVRESYRNPLETYQVNALGTANLLNALRAREGITAVVNVTTDKCYYNMEWIWPYRESDRLGGKDPYSSSKACSELITEAYRHSFFMNSQTFIASARAGNVIGGGDYSCERLIPDLLKASDSCSPLFVRNPSAIRPWQHVLEPLSGYLILAEKLYMEGREYEGAWNFGPDIGTSRSVGWIIDCLKDRLGITISKCSDSMEMPEANRLTLDSSKAQRLLGWKPLWNLETALDLTVDWHMENKSGRPMREFTLRQISDYEQLQTR